VTRPDASAARTVAVPALSTRDTSPPASMYRRHHPQGTIVTPVSPVMRAGASYRNQRLVNHCVRAAPECDEAAAQPAHEPEGNSRHRGVRCKSPWRPPGKHFRTAYQLVSGMITASRSGMSDQLRQCTGRADRGM
jgi:hypothetical protein